jgi:membrane peptidoglycan carboxypeptidase
MESQLDLCRITDVARRLGVHLAVPQSECGRDRPTRDLPNCVPSLTLGAKEIAPLTMAAAYASFAAGGIHCDPYPVRTIEASGSTPGLRTAAFTASARCARAVDRDVADGVTAALREVIAQGTAAGIRPLPWDAAGKTGTTDGPYDSWFVGYTAQRSTAVWVADPGRPGAGGTVDRRLLRRITVGGSYHDTIYGATIAAPLWKQVMTAAMRGQPRTNLP